MRYTVGNTYCFVQVLFTKPEGRYGSLYLPWEDTLNEINIIKLVCSHHEKVAWDQDPKGEKIYDGFLFTDDFGNRWSNQYPTANYSQSDTSDDMNVRRYFETHELLVVDENGNVVYDNDGKSKIKDDDLWKIFDQQMFYPYQRATNYLGRMYRAINAGDSTLSDAQKASLQTVMNTVQIKVEEAMGKKIKYVPFEYTSSDGTHRVTNFYEAKFED